MPLLYFLEGIRTPWLDHLMALITYLGSEAFFMVLALLFFWCIDKKQGYYLLSVGFFGTVINQFLKLAFRIVRPWVLDPDFTIVEAARADATGYSFPSGHTQNAVGTLGGIARSTKKCWLRIVCVLLAVAVAFSRMYLGVHTPLDVGVSLLIAVTLVFLLWPLMQKAQKKPVGMYVVFAVMLLLAGAYVVYAQCFPFPADVDMDNLISGQKNGYSLLGALLGLILVYWVDEHWLHFETRAIWWAQILKLTLGLALVLVVKSLLKQPLLSLCGGHLAAHLLRYFMIVLTAGIIWPFTFRFFAGLGRKQ